MSNPRIVLIEVMNNDNTQYFSILFGLEYSKTIESKPQFFDSAGNLRVEEVLIGLAYEYRRMKDDKLIQELIVLKKQTATALRSGDESLFVDLQIKRQILTNAYALNHGASNISIKQISVLGDDYLKKLQLVFAFFMAQESLFEKFPSAFSSLTDDFHSQILQNSYLSNLDAKTKSLFESLFYSMYSLRRFFSLRAWTKILYRQTFPTHFSLLLAEVYISHFGLNEFQKIVDEFNSINGHFENMVNKFQMPPYGVALALGYEDDGQRVLPWHGNLSDSKILQIRRKMHEYVAKGEASEEIMYDAVIAAYCCSLFVRKPSKEQIKEEFWEVKHNKTTYYRNLGNTNEKIKELETILQGDWDKDYHIMVYLKNHKEEYHFYELFKELIEIRNKA